MKREGFGTCALCGEMILPGEPTSPASFDGREVHVECGFRAIIGSANHILRICTCYVKGGEQHQQPHMSKRDDARWAFKVAAWVRELGVVIAKEQAKKKPARGGPEGDSSG